MNIQLSEHFTYRKLLRFTLPSMVMMVFTSIYGVVDGVFISNFVGSDPFAAINLIMPFLMILGALGFMLGSGGSALVGFYLGMGQEKRANEIFSLLIYVLLGVGAALTVLGLLFLEPVARLLGADADLLPYCVRYGRIVLLGLVPFTLQNVFQSFLVTAERPHFGLYITVGAGVTNMVLDALLVAVIPLEVEGAAIATVISQCVGGFLPLIYFLRPNTSRLRLTRTHWELQPVLKSAANGSSEFMTNISMSIVTMLYNWQLLRLMGADGVTVFGIIMYVSFIFVALFLGYSMGSAPIVSFHYGAGNQEELRGLFRQSLTIILSMSVGLTLLAIVLAKPLAMIFVSYDPALLSVTTRALAIYAVSYLLTGFNIYASSFFTALNDGAVSAAISFMRALVLPVICIIVMPMLWQLDGVWYSLVGSEVLGVFVSLYFLLAKRKKYHY